MAYKIVVTVDAKNDLEQFINYLIFDLQKYASCKKCFQYPFADERQNAKTYQQEIFGK